MVGFEQKLGEEQVQDWRFAYLNYEALKTQISLMEQADPKRENFDTAKLMFQRHVDAEITRVVYFYQVKLAEIQRKILYLQTRKQKLAHFLKEYMRSNSELLMAVEEELQLWRQVAVEVKNLMDFVTLNLAGVRKIEKKFIKNFGQLDIKKSEGKGISSSIQIQHPHEQKQFLVASFLPNEIMDLFAKMQQLEELNEAKEIIARTMAQLHGRRIYLSGDDRSVAGAAKNEIQSQLSGKYNHLAFSDSSSSEEGQQKGTYVPGSQQELEVDEDDPVDQAWKQLMEKARLSQNEQKPTLGPGVSSVGDYESVIMEMIDAEQRAQQESGLFRLNQFLAAQAGIFTPAPSDETAVATTLGLALNLISTLLYMTNYNFVIPLINPLTRQLDQPSSMGGTIVGVSDVTAMIAAFLYSWWTNKFFKIPLVVSCVVLMVSNILFSISYDIQNKNVGLAVLLIARLLTGLGAARSLNRRYIADFVSVKNRTKASAGFVAASAAGMSLGPLLALPLSYIVESKYAILGTAWTINDVTMGGYIMFALWLVYGIVAFFLFEEPKRKLNEMIIRTSYRSAEEEVTTPLLSHNENDERNQDLHEENRLVKSNDLEQARDLQNNQSRQKYNMLKDPAMKSVGVCILMLFMLKLAQQGTISSTAIFQTPLTYGAWKAAEVGLYLALVNLAVLPCNFLVAAISPHASDRLIMLISVLIAWVGCTVLLNIPSVIWPLTFIRYLFGTILILIATLGLECVSMSLMSKKISPQMAMGTLNAGLLSTISGSLGRFLGNEGITLLGGLASSLSGYPLRITEGVAIENIIVSVTYLANLMFGIFDVTVIVCLIVYFVSFRSMRVEVS
eukprot:TRINITY_DN4309_c0_g1_i1.p1 TRINITY_DN4309_c0_g1~~TRINITY_DN4309_c0_g1_i1.p1  ORF type:complete len:888 (-),score=107.73 TRINITY_DN4309_c0_g1_i1:634-3165(-)